MSVNNYIAAFQNYINNHPFDGGNSDCETVLDQLYQAYAESNESDPVEISGGFKELEELYIGFENKQGINVFFFYILPSTGT